MNSRAGRLLRAVILVAATVGFPCIALLGYEVPPRWTAWKLPLAEMVDQSAKAASRPGALPPPVLQQTSLERTAELPQDRSLPGRREPTEAGMPRHIALANWTSESPSAFSGQRESTGSVSYLSTSSTPQAGTRAGETHGSREHHQQRILARLEALGVVQLKIQRWGAGDTLVRCHGCLPRYHQSGFHRYFEAVGRDSLSALADLLRQVEAAQEG